VRFASTQETELDSLGRTSALEVDGHVLYTLSYDDEGRLAHADFTSGETITFDYDPVTHRRNGHVLAASAPSVATGGVHWDRDARGLISDETYSHSATSTRRDYGYDGRGALTTTTTSGEVAQYTYTASGLPDTISDPAGARSVHRTGNQLTAGGVVYSWDSAGRMVGAGDWTYSYGADGQLDGASRPGRQIEFVYDDGDQRLLKRVEGVPVRANVAGGVLTEDHFVELVTIGGVVAGVLDNGAFIALPTDPRGTPFVGPNGTPNLASPYGVRSSHLGYAEAIDYTRLGWDPDLDIVRMGVRDYVPRLSQFLTPDPLYFENVDKCRESPLQCTLYGYASGNPLSFVDPTGTQAWNPTGQGPGIFDSLFDFSNGAFITNVKDPSNYVPAIAAVATIATAGVAITGLSLSSLVGEAAESTNFSLASSAIASRPTAVTATVAATALASQADKVSNEVEAAAGAFENVVPRAGNIVDTVARNSNTLQVTANAIQRVVAGSHLQTQQQGISLPVIQNYVDRCLAGEVAPPVKMDGNIIVDGVHRYVAGALANLPPAVQNWTAPQSSPLYPLADIVVDSTDWGHR
jgi:RHS repeat-associated protein